MAILGQFITTVSDFLWNYILVFLLCGVGVFFMFKLKFIQITKLKQSFVATFGGLKFGKKAETGKMNSFQALATAISAQVGTGCLAGTATALIMGGPGAIFWMWVSGFLGMGTIFAEATLAQEYRSEINGQMVGGPAYYIKKGLKNKYLAGFFAGAMCLSSLFTGNAVQSNAIGTAFKASFGINPYIMGAILVVLALMILLGGMSRIGSFAEKVVPIMAGIFVVGSVFIIGANYKNIWPAFQLIFKGAFSPDAVVGATAGVIIKNAMRYGMARGLFSNEAGMGSTPHAHAVADVKHPCQQGLVAMMGVFIDNFIILTLTAMVIMTTISPAMFSDYKGIDLTQAAFTVGMGGFGGKFVAISLFFFAFSTIIGWYFFGETNVKYLFGKKGVVPFQAIFLTCTMIGCALRVDLVWAMADLCNGLMVLPNILALFALSNIVKKKLEEYSQLDVTSKIKTVNK
ncbi:alanine or glycine:cation symporter, AGCS family [Hathewaya proteolytica DSM 3090]|uniref:Alanine or glycine:cation symporter, AGCS family n=1 Tax=Hathewaya proteolytica DSM 3090 TaxID=1121331 RepID=A0A1M6P6Q7_9CLOT|nr:sodium:alanine symporter family protein [Hathewaya proteolytica]SHK03572.1 alanine or glycine:cation symporter, AGCS family [Hathewaya proteolytica DSM 3090]